MSPGACLPEPANAASRDLVAPGVPAEPFHALAAAARDTLTRGRELVRRLEARHEGLEITDLHPVLDRLRARKSKAAIALLREAGR